MLSLLLALCFDFFGCCCLVRSLSLVRSRCERSPFPYRGYFACSFVSAPEVFCLSSKASSVGGLFCAPGIDAFSSPLACGLSSGLGLRFAIWWIILLLSLPGYGIQASCFCVHLKTHARIWLSVVGGGSIWGSLTALPFFVQPLLSGSLLWLPGFRHGKGSSSSCVDSVSSLALISFMEALAVCRFLVLFSSSVMIVSLGLVSVVMLLAF